MTVTLTAKQAEARAVINGPASHVLMVGGSRSGKTFMMARTNGVRGIAAPGSRHLIMRKQAVACKQAVGMDTWPKVARLHGWPYRFFKQDGLIVLPNEAEIWLAGLDSHNLEKVLGKEFATISENEASEIPFEVHEQLRSRRAQVVDCIGSDGRNHGPLRLLTLVDLNPTTKAHWTYRLWIDGINPASGEPVDMDDYAHIFMNPYDNRENLPPDYIASLESMSPRMRKRFLEGQYLADLEEALWRRSMILRTQRNVKDLKRLVVAIDPAASNKPGSDETGIIAAGIDADGYGYVLEDESGKMRPEEWADRALALWRDLDADCIVAEANQGGDMVESTIRAREPRYRVQGRPPPRVKLVNAIKGKRVRAEPISGLYERGKIFHVGTFSELEDQMCAYTIDFDRKEQGVSPDRMDALVWAFTELFGDLTKRAPRNAGERKPERPMAEHSWMGN